MSIKLIQPKEGKSPFWYARGKHLEIFVDRSTKTTSERVAKIQIKQWERQIERGEYIDPRKPPPEVEAGPPMFLAAAVAYMQAGGERAYILPIITEWRSLTLAGIDQVLIDTTATKLYPNATAATRNRQFYTPVSAIRKRAGDERKIKRPKGWRGKKSISWLEPEQAFALFEAADTIDAEFGIFVRTLCYTGMRLGEALKIKLAQLDLERRAIYLPETKNSHARTVHLPPFIVTTLANHPRKLTRDSGQRLFRFHASGHLRNMLKTATAKAGLSFPRRQCGFHLFCHTYGTWMHRFGGLDNFALSRTDRWRDPRSAEIYLHTEVNSEARQADVLPIPHRSGR
jgi:integrase